MTSTYNLDELIDKLEQKFSGYKIYNPNFDNIPENLNGLIILSTGEQHITEATIDKLISKELDVVRSINNNIKTSKILTVTDIIRLIHMDDFRGKNRKCAEIHDGFLRNIAIEYAKKGYISIIGFNIMRPFNINNINYIIIGGPDLILIKDNTYTIVEVKTTEINENKPLSIFLASSYMILSKGKTQAALYALSLYQTIGNNIYVSVDLAIYSKENSNLMYKNIEHHYASSLLRELNKSEIRNLLRATPKMYILKTNSGKDINYVINITAKFTHGFYTHITKLLSKTLNMRKI
ncbi:MAG: hypothetical protein ACP5G1_00220 [Nanopusillaceae archaeon]